MIIEEYRMSARHNGQHAQTIQTVIHLVSFSARLGLQTSYQRRKINTFTLRISVWRGSASALFFC